VAIEQRDSHGRAGKAASGVEAAKTSSDDHDMWCGRGSDGCMLS
jgi:hypothetical protein